MFTNDGYALLIGVDDYSAFDRSHQQPTGTSNLKGSCNDVRTWWRLCRLLGMRPANIRVLTSPPIPFAELEGASSENVAPATEAEILAKTGWLASMLGQPSRPTGLLTYSGHGDWITGKGLVLCPSDVTWSARSPDDVDLDDAVPFRTINALFTPAAAENLTVVLDTCHSGWAADVAGSGPVKAGKPLTLTQRPLAKMPGVMQSGTAPELEELSGRVLAAARRDQVAYQSMFDGGVHGVFTWALAAAMDQWRATQEGNAVRLDVSYGTLVDTAQRLISALLIDQTPQLHGPDGVADLAVFHPGLAGHPGETSARPDGGLMALQLDPGNRGYVIYTLSVNGFDVGSVLVTNTAGGGYDANKEYWYDISGLSLRSAVTFTAGAAQAWSTPPTGLTTLSFTMARTPTWTSGSPSAKMFVYSNALTGEFDAMDWHMSNSSGTWTGSITWWHSSTGNLFGPGVTRTLSPTTPSGTYYYYTGTPI